MRRSASEILRNLDMRIAHLEKKSGSSLKLIAATSKESQVIYQKYKDKIPSDKFLNLFLVCCAMKGIKVSKLDYLAERLGGDSSWEKLDQNTKDLAKDICKSLSKPDLYMAFIQINMKHSFVKRFRHYIRGILGVDFPVYDLENIEDCMELVYPGMGITEDDFEKLRPTSNGYKLMTYANQKPSLFGYEEEIKKTINGLKEVSSKRLIVDSFNKDDISFV
jgi:hypothetical protein